MKVNAENFDYNLDTQHSGRKMLSFHFIIA